VNLPAKADARPIAKMPGKSKFSAHEFLRRREGSGRFLKKAAQKFLAMLGHGRCQRQRPWPSIIKFFLLLFVHKK
jgi:hypothetical protein